MSSSALTRCRSQRRRATWRSARRVTELLLAVAGIAFGCGPVDHRYLGGTGSTIVATGGTLGGGGSGNAPGANGGSPSTSGKGNTSAAEAGASDTAGIGETAGELGGDAGQGSSSATCGNGIVEAGEECDDGNLQPGDGCDAECRKEACGNGRIDAGEQCEPPGTSTCTAHCNLVSSECGDGKIEGDEQCDDGNDKAGDGCFECRNECGDGVIDASIGEQCEPEYAPTLCSSTCHWLPYCGDGIVQPDLGEECDPGNGTTCVGCRFVKNQECDGGAGGCGGAADGCVQDGSGGPVQNGNFDTTSDDWTPSSSSVSAGVVNDGYPSPMALEVSLASGPVRAEAGAYQCVPVSGAQKYDFEARYLIPSDAPDGVGAAVTALLYTGTQCSGTFLKAFNGAEGLARDAWTQYSLAIDLSAVSSGPAYRLLLRLDVVRPESVDGSRVRWDDVTLLEPSPRCGDCVVDPGEECDDGNHTAGDGCGPDCQLERCGDGILAPNEECDDGNTTFGGADTCTPACRNATACDTCSAGACQSQLDACFGLTGVAEAGPGAGIARSTLCDKLLTCVRNTGCDLVQRPSLQAGKTTSQGFQENCYCGTSGPDCFDGAANGSCRAETEAALETTNPSTISGRFDGKQPDYPAFEAVSELIACQTSNCTECARNPACGDGVREDRNLSVDMIVDGKEVACDDAHTATGRGCDFEECDPPGDGSADEKCDQYCLLVLCGNGVTEPGEDCDDGNRVSGDGCSADCKAEYDCGDGELQAPFEQCDRGTPDAGTASGAGPGATCTLDQSQSDPNSCACDDKCQLVVCGNGVVQRPYEQCDPPDGSTCDTNCQAIGKTDCEICLDADAAEADVQSSYCESGPGVPGGMPGCVPVERCMIESKCFNPLPSFCYCGTTDVTACSKPSFMPTGPCVDVIQAGETATNNSDALSQLFDFTIPAGIATDILNDAFTNAPECKCACFGLSCPQDGSSGGSSSASQ